MITIWKRGVINPLFSFKDNGFLGLNAEWKGNNLYFINVYSSCCLVEKRSLWNSLLTWKQKLSVGEWIIGGDFNAGKMKEEHKGRFAGCNREMEEFSKFLELLEVGDLPLIKNKFTWISLNGQARSRIDHILVSVGIIDSWNVVAQECGKRDISNHMPVWLKASILNWRPKPFKVLNYWYEHVEFLDFVKSQWDSFNVQGSSAFILEENFRRLRDNLRW